MLGRRGYQHDPVTSRSQPEREPPEAAGIVSVSEGRLCDFGPRTPELSSRRGARC
jgi:hypothetical protein